MPQKKKTYFNWSTGKDSALALYYLQQENKLKVDKLVTTVNSHYNRVSMHGLRNELLIKQAEVLGLPLTTIELPEAPSMEDYNNIMTKAVNQLKQDGYRDCAFGDIYLEDLRAYREEQLKGINCHFPLWKKDTSKLIKEFIELGFKTVVTCINNELLDESFVGRTIDQSFLEDLPSNVDPCGENGEFHTFCYDGPIFSKPIDFKIGNNTFREYDKPNSNGKTGFWFCDLVS